MSGITGQQAELLYSLPAAVTKNTYTTLAVISAPAATAPVAKIQGGFLNSDPGPVGRAFYLKAFGSIANTSAATFIPSLGFNTTAGTPINNVPFCTAVTPTASVVCQWSAEAWITCQAAGETGGTTFQVNGNWRISTVAAGGAANASMLAAEFAQTVTGLQSALTYYVELAGTWSASASGNTTTLQQEFFWGLN
jgi:hypothetical protein